MSSVTEPDDVVVIVIINDPTLSFADRYKLFPFSKRDAAYRCAQQHGYDDPFQLGLNTTVGYTNQYRCGAVDVQIGFLPNPSRQAGSTSG
jgi:hypothetical protein